MPWQNFSRTFRNHPFPTSFLIIFDENTTLTSLKIKNSSVSEKQWTWRKEISVTYFRKLLRKKSIKRPTDTCLNRLWWLPRGNPESSDWILRSWRKITQPFPERLRNVATLRRLQSPSWPCGRPGTPGSSGGTWSTDPQNGATAAQARHRRNCNNQPHIETRSNGNKPQIIPSTKCITSMNYSSWFWEKFNFNP